jgi:hypothetical protein
MAIIAVSLLAGFLSVLFKWIFPAIKTLSRLFIRTDKSINYFTVKSTNKPTIGRLSGDVQVNIFRKREKTQE